MKLTNEDSRDLGIHYEHAQSQPIWFINSNLKNHTQKYILETIKNNKNNKMHFLK